MRTPGRRWTSSWICSVRESGWRASPSTEHSWTTRVCANADTKYILCSFIYCTHSWETQNVWTLSLFSVMMLSGQVKTSWVLLSVFPWVSNARCCLSCCWQLSSITADSTGTHSLYTTYKDYELMFHVSTLLPYTPNNRQQVRVLHFLKPIYSLYANELSCDWLMSSHRGSEYPDLFYCVMMTGAFMICPL